MVSTDLPVPAAATTVAATVLFLLKLAETDRSLKAWALALPPLMLLVAFLIAFSSASVFLDQASKVSPLSMAILLVSLSYPAAAIAGAAGLLGRANRERKNLPYWFAALFAIVHLLIAGYLAAMKKMQDEFSLAGEPDLNVIARLPNVLLPKKDDLSEEFIVGVERAVNAALDDLEKMRENEGEMLRNATVTTVAPTGTISIIAGTTSGIEPLYGIAFVRNVLGGDQLLEVNPVFEAEARRLGCLSDDLLRRVLRDGSIARAADVPEELRRVGDRFWRSARHQNVSGSGLGLAVSRALLAPGGGSLSFAASSTNVFR